MNARVASRSSGRIVIARALAFGECFGGSASPADAYTARITALSLANSYASNGMTFGANYPSVFTTLDFNHAVVHASVSGIGSPPDAGAGADSRASPAGPCIA